MQTTSSDLLLVTGDDECWNRLGRELSARGWHVTRAADVQAAIDLAVRHQPRVIVTDVHPPRVSGFHFVRTLRGVVEHDVVVVGLGRTAQILEKAKGGGFDLTFETSVDLDVLDEALTSPTGDDDKPTARIRPLKR